MNGYAYLAGSMGGWILNEYDQTGKKFSHFQPAAHQEFHNKFFSLIES